MTTDTRRLSLKLTQQTQVQNIGDLNLRFKKIRVAKLLWRGECPDPAVARNLHVSLRGYNTHVNVCDVPENSGVLRPYFFNLPLGEGQFVSYINVTSGAGGTWDFTTTRPKQLETQLVFELFIDNVAWTPPADGLLLELEVHDDLGVYDDI